MRILLVSQTGSGAWFILRLLNEGHSVDYYLLKEKYAGILKGIVPKPMHQKPNFSKYDLILFDQNGKPKLAEEAMKYAPTIGDGNFSTTLEEDRLFGIEVMESCGIKVPPYEVFNDINSAKKFINESGKRWVFKPNGDQPTATTYVSEDAEDLVEYIDRLSQDMKGDEFILQEFVEDGVEISTEAYFNGKEFFIINSTLEEKKFMEGGKGPNTGCSGNIVWTYGQEPRIFKQGLGLMKDYLREYDYVGMIDLNTIATRSDVFGLEWTPRFGYDASATLLCNITNDWGQFLYDIATGGSPDVRTSLAFSASTRLSIPPYPSECEGYYHEDVPINGIEPEDIEQIYLCDAKLEHGELMTAGIGGLVAAPIGLGRSMEEAWGTVEKKIKNIKIPDMQYRQDMYKCTNERYLALSAMGWLK